MCHTQPNPDSDSDPYTDGDTDSERKCNRLSKCHCQRDSHNSRGCNCDTYVCRRFSGNCDTYCECIFLSYTNANSCHRNGLADLGRCGSRNFGYYRINTFDILKDLGIKGVNEV